MTPSDRSAPGALRRALVATLFMAACGDSGPPPPAPTSINMFPAETRFDAVGDTRTFVAAVRDQNGIAMDGQTVTWASSNSSVVSIDQNGRARAEGNGSATIRATVGDAVGTAPVTVAQVATTLAKLAGDGQAGPAGSALSVALEVQVTDRLGGFVAGQPIGFSIIGGGGSVAPATAQTDAQGRATSTWTLGPRAGEPQAARAAITGTGVPGVAFSATGFAGPPAELRALSGSGQAGLVGTALPLPLSVQVLDAFQNPLASDVAFSVTGGGGSLSHSLVTTGALGVASTVWTLGTAPGNHTVRATSSGLTWDFMASAVTTAGPSASLDIVSGDAQFAPAGSAVRDPLAVVVRDAQGIGVAGVDVTFAPSEGEVAPAVSTTNASGVAATSWTLGTTVGPQEVQASTGALAPVTFMGEGRDPGPTCILGTPDPDAFNIQVCYTVPVTESVRAAFERAARRWESLITGDQPDLPPNPDAHTTCVTSQAAPPIQGPILDDLVIYATIEPIDGEFNVLGSAGPCLIRNSNQLTTVGAMRFDIADTDRLEASGQFEDVILHEMGHVLGLGTLWNTKGFLQNPASPNQTTIPDTHFNGPLAIAAFDASGGLLRTAGQKVPVENAQGGGGSLNGHWRETVMDRELMTPFLDGNVANPLSIISVQAMADIGYTVSNTAADAYTVPSPNAALKGAPGATDQKILLLDDILWMPLRVVDETGRVVRILPAGGGGN